MKNRDEYNKKFDKTSKKMLDVIKRSKEERTSHNNRLGARVLNAQPSTPSAYANRRAGRAQDPKQPTRRQGKQPRGAHFIWF